MLARVCHSLQADLIFSCRSRSTSRAPTRTTARRTRLARRGTSIGRSSHQNSLTSMDSRETAGRAGSADGPWLLNVTDRVDVERYLVSQGMLTPDAMPITIARAGAGNMNLALRVTTQGGGSFIVKQGRPWVEKY